MFNLVSWATLLTAITDQSEKLLRRAPTHCAEAPSTSQAGDMRGISTTRSDKVTFGVAYHSEPVLERSEDILVAVIPLRLVSLRRGPGGGGTGPGHSTRLTRRGARRGQGKIRRRQRPCAAQLVKSG